MSFHTITILLYFGLCVFRTNGQLEQLYFPPGTVSRPNIILITADDLGRNDVSFNNNNELIMTPNIDALGYYGIILNRFHSCQTCTPSRAALLTGRYGTITGLRHNDIENDQPYALGLEQDLFPTFLKIFGGYSTNLIGKWHLGFYNHTYTPIQRGFDTFYGFLGQYITYLNHDSCLPRHLDWPSGYDMRTNDSIDFSTKGQHSTDLFTSKAVELINNHDTTIPFFLMLNYNAPHSENTLCPFPWTDECWKYLYIWNPIQRKLAGQITKMDTNIGRVIQALDNKNMLANSVIVFMSDNGAPTLGEYYTFGSNYPLRGQKNTPWEGATRVPAIIWSPLLKNTQYVSNGRIHITDFFKTLIKLGRADLGIFEPNSLVLDLIVQDGGPNFTYYFSGYDIWPMLSYGGGEIRESILHNIDDYTSYTKGDWKYIRYNKFSLESCLYQDKWLGLAVQHDCLLNLNKFTYYDQVRNSETAKVLRKYANGKKELSDDFIKGIRSQTKICCNYKIINFCKPWLLPCLFNVKYDPCEHENLYFQLPDKVKEMENDINNMKVQVLRNCGGEDAANPAYHGYVWNWWKD